MLDRHMIVLYCIYMEIRVLKYFLAVAREGSITGAANSLHLTQPTLTRQIQDLEKELGQKLLNEVLVLDSRTNVPILSLQPFGQQGYDYAVKIRTMNVADHDDLQRMVGYQIRKFNACRKCLKCESLCPAGAISIISDNYYINPDKCVHCKMCVTPKYLDGGCMMDKYLRTK